MPAEGERQVRQWHKFSTWELKQADIDMQHNATTPGPGKGAFPQEKHRQAPVTAKIIMPCCTNLL